MEAGGGVYGGRKGQRVPGIKYGSRQGRCRARDLYGYLTTRATVTESGVIKRTLYIYIYIMLEEEAYVKVHMSVVAERSRMDTSDRSFRV